MHYVLVISGKGGTGKTLVSINLAHALAKKRGMVALVDADISNPNAAEVLGIKEQLTFTSNSFDPVNIKVDDSTIEFFSMVTISGTRPVSMDAAEYAQILRDVLEHTKWKSGIMVIDMPAGVHNEFLDIIANFGENLLGSVIVLQPAHVVPARKLLEIHKTEGIPVIGVIQNMATFTCDGCQKTFGIFGTVDLEALCKEFDVKALGSIPLSMEIRSGVANGQPYLSDALSGPIQNAAAAVMEAKPVGVSFTQRIKEKLKGIARDALLDIMAAVIEISNTEVKIRDLQQQFGFEGGRVIELDITDETLRVVKVQTFFRIENGLLKVVVDPRTVDDELRVWDRALLWCILGARPDTKAPFDLSDAWLQGKVKYLSNSRGTPRALEFMRSVWTGVRESPSFVKLKPIIEKLA